MKTTIVIPTYWRPPTSELSLCDPETDYLYDHATPLDEEGTLANVLEGLSAFEQDEELTVAVVAVPVRRELNQAVQLKVGSIVARFDYRFPMFLVGPDELALWRRRMAISGMGHFEHLLSLNGYANVRNMCLLAARLTGADTAVLLDDDQVVTDSGYLDKAREFIGQEHDGGLVTVVTGRPANASQAPEYNYERSLGGSSPWTPGEGGVKWQQLWGSEGAIGEALAGASGRTRLERTPLVFGGGLVLHHTLFESVPFDPSIPRGEDVDYMINAMFFGHRVYMDNELQVESRPVPLCTPPWYQLRKDITRFSIERAKLAGQRSGSDLRHVSLDELDPYPGRFLHDDFHDIVLVTSLEMASAYLAAGREAEAEECMANVAISRAEAELHGDLFGDYVELQEQWREFMSILPVADIWQPSDTLD